MDCQIFMVIMFEEPILWQSVHIIWERLLDNFDKSNSNINLYNCEKKITYKYCGTYL
jgi:hypothetical protein